MLYSLVLVILVGCVAATAPTKPVWPLSFSYPFGVSDPRGSPPLVNATGILYYQWPFIQTQLIDYPDQCIELTPGTSKGPCKLLFNNVGISYSAPTLGVDCCLAIPNVGSIPPDFLRAFTWSNVENMTDYYGREHVCDHWLGGAFQYWTDQLTGLDVRINDGPDVIWHMGTFDVSAQNPDNLRIANGDCSKPCPSRLRLAEMLHEKVPLVRLASYIHKRTGSAGRRPLRH